MQDLLYVAMLVVPYWERRVVRDRLQQKRLTERHVRPVRRPAPKECWICWAKMDMRLGIRCPWRFGAASDSLNDATRPCLSRG